ncbi:MAG: hypothetical protein Q9218_007523 [Villophora microphyllina]
MSITQTDQTISASSQDPPTAQKSSWNSLPQELKTQILSLAGTFPPDWKNARLVSRNWADTAAPFIFEEKWLTPCTLFSLKDLPSLEAVRQYVKHLIIFVTSTLPDIPYGRWEEGCSRGPFALPQHEIVEGYDRYSTIPH